MSISPLPSMEHTFNLSIKGNRTGRVYDGTFTFKIPDLKTESAIEKARVRLNEGLTLSEDTDFIHEMLAFLTHTLIESPEWWKNQAARLEIYDLNVYTELYQEANKFRAEYQKKVWSDDGDQPK